MYLSHTDKQGTAVMVDVGLKEKSRRCAVVETKVVLNADTFKLIKKEALPKGDVLNTAKIAGILAAKKTSSLIPLCHPLNITFIDITFHFQEALNIILIRAKVRAEEKTGVEMEAFVAAQVAALTIYDMCKSVQQDILITDCKLIHKSGGKLGEYSLLIIDEN